MSKKKKREERNNGIRNAVHNIVSRMVPSFQQIENNEEEIKKTRKEKREERKRPRYEQLVIKVVDSIENKKKLDREAFNELIGMHPHLEPIVREMISQANLYSIYDTDPLAVNFDYSRWLKKIKIKLEA
jgi:hypothetical protein